VTSKGCILKQTGVLCRSYNILRRPVLFLLSASVNQFKQETTKLEGFSWN